MHFAFLLFIHFASAIPLVDFLLDENPDLTLEISSTNLDLFLVPTDSDPFFEAENAADFLLADTDLCLSDVNVDFLSTSKIRTRDSCPSTDFDPALTIPTFSQASPGLKVIERARLNKIFGIGSTTRLKNSDGNDLCPFATTFGSTMQSAILEAGLMQSVRQAVTIRSFIFDLVRFARSFLPSFFQLLSRFSTSCNLKIKIVTEEILIEFYPRHSFTLLPRPEFLVVLCVHRFYETSNSFKPLGSSARFFAGSATKSTLYCFQSPSHLRCNS